MKSNAYAFGDVSLVFGEVFDDMEPAILTDETLVEGNLEVYPDNILDYYLVFKEAVEALGLLKEHV